MPPWLPLIYSYLRKESNNSSSRYVYLSTIGIDNTPKVRTVVFRGWSQSYEMEIYTDKRSQKYEELDFNKNVEICWFFSKSKCQLRLSGTTRILLGNENIHHWKKLSEKSKSMWFWPKPGDNFKFDQIKKSDLKKKHDISKNFALLTIDINHVDQLILNKTIHERRRWIKKNEWIEERINP